MNLGKVWEEVGVVEMEVGCGEVEREGEKMCWGAGGEIRVS